MLRIGPSFCLLFVLGLLLDTPLSALDGGLLGLPAPLGLEHRAVSVTYPAPGSLDLGAPAGSNLFLSPDGGYVADSAPRLMFAPRGPFVLSARLRPEFGRRWDAASLILWSDATHYAKFCYEMDYRGKLRVVTVVCNEVCDDCNSMEVPEGSIYFRVVGSAERREFSFYVSKDGVSWFLVRDFRLHKADNLRLGFSAQSPDGPGCVAHFTEIRYESRAVKDRWQGD